MMRGYKGKSRKHKR